METERHERLAGRSAVGRALASAVLLLAMAATLGAQQPQGGQTAVPQLLPVMGALAGPDGAPLSGSMGVTFAIYADQQGGEPLWMERQIVTADGNGRYAVWVGGLGQALPAQVFQAGQARWMGVTPDGQLEQPRARFLAVPFTQPIGNGGTGFVGNGGDALAGTMPVANPVDPQKHASRRDPTELAGVFDQVIPDDLIVQGSACVGLDCVNNENFGFDTIRVKENNTRIQFNDTSAAGFPTNNWQIRANDSGAGGASYLGFVDQGAAGESETGTISFRVTAGAPANSLNVGSTGKVGFRTAAPVLDLHVTTNDTPAWRMEQSNAGGFQAQTWDVAGNEANFFVRDVTSGSRLPFRIRPGAPTSSIDVSADGDVGIGTGSPAERLDVVGGNIQTSGFVLFAGGVTGLRNAAGIVAFDAGSAFPSGYRFGTTGDVQAFTMNTAGDVGFGVAAPLHPIHMASTAHVTAGGVWTNASSRTLKDRIAPLTSEAAAAVLDGLQPMTYVYKTDPTDPQVGFIAEDVPELVATPDRKGLASMDIVAVAVKIIQEQQRQLAELREASRSQEEAVAALKARLTDLERLLAEVRRER